MSEQQWDYIIVGAGTAGPVLANKLSADPSKRVLVLEAGPDYPGSEIPDFLRGNTLETGMSTTPGPEMLPEYYWLDISCRRRPGGEVIPYPRGRGAGGSSTVNGLVWVRAEADDFRAWGEHGVTGWSFDEVLPHMNAVEGDLEYGAEPYHGGEGPVPVYRGPRETWGDVDVALEEAALTAGFTWDDDYNRPGSTGISRYPSSNTAGFIRITANHAYLDPARDRENLVIRGDSHVARVVFDGETAVGVELLDGSVIRVVEGGEVILSAGAVHSPAILMRSGVGPQEHLDDLGIPVVRDLPVGSGAQDHAIVFLEFQPHADRVVPPEMRPTHVSVRYSSGLEGTTTNDVAIIATNHNYWFGNDRAGLAVQLNQALSRGTVRLRSADPADSPHMELNLLDHPADRIRLQDGLDRARAFMDSTAFRELRVGDPLGPTNPEELTAQAKEVMHICGSAPMGAEGSEYGVLDSSCRVHGLNGLRVVDASIFPTVPSANLNFTVFATAHRTAALILDEAV